MPAFRIGSREGLSGRRRAFRPINEADQSERKSGAAPGGKSRPVRAGSPFCDFPAAPRPKDAFSHARAPRRIRDVPRRASGRKRRAPHRAGRRKRPQNDFAESPKASANGKNVFSFRKPAPPCGKAATAYGIRSRANAIPQARTAPVMKRPCRARRAALRRTQIGRRECFIGKPYAAGQHKRLFENAAHRHAAAICAPAGCSAPQRRRNALSALRIIDYNKAPFISY